MARPNGQRDGSKYAPPVEGKKNRSKHDSVWLVVQGKDWPDSAYRIKPGCQPVGRSRECDFHLSHLSVSRFHAEIEHTGTSLIIRDLGSKNGTFVNDSPVKEHEFVIGDTLRLGLVRMDVVAGTTRAPDIEDSVTTPRIQEMTVTGRRPEEERLTLKERSVFRLMLRGLSRKDIARALGLSVDTIHTNFKHIFRKFRVGSRAELMGSFLSQTAEWKQLMAGTKGL